MANYLDANPGIAACVSGYMATGQFVPIARNGELFCYVSHRRASDMTLAQSLSVADYVVGLELLGFEFATLRGSDGEFYVMWRERSWGRDDMQGIPDSCRDREHAIRMAFDAKARWDEVKAYLIERDVAFAPIDEASA